MMKFCPECGYKLEKQYKFCPNCGVSLALESNQVENSEKSEVIICDNCGEENFAGNIVCSSCGIKLKGEKTASSGTEKKNQIMEKKELPKRNPVKVSKPQTGSNISSTEKKIDSKKIILIFGVILGITIILLAVTGTFDSTPENTVTRNEGVNSGVDLSSIEQINKLEEQVKASPDNMELLLQLAHLKNDSGLYDRAISDYKKYLTIRPEDADARIDMGVCYFNLKQYEPAIIEMKKALEYKPRHQIGHLNLGIVNLAAGNLEESKEWLRKAVDIDPNSEIGKRAQELLQSH